MYREGDHKKLYLRQKSPSQKEYARLRQNLYATNIISSDKDYGGRVIRVNAAPDMPADQIVCIVDRLCHLSHISAMQRWGLTDRTPGALILTRPDKQTSRILLSEIMAKDAATGEPNPFPLKIPSHPMSVRGRRVQVHDSRTPGDSIQARGEFTRLSTIGQTFVDMIQRPDLCGGMSHVIDVWEEHAETYVDDIVEAVDKSPIAILKSRAGYILEERLELQDRRVETWKKFGARGGSRKLDPSKGFSSNYSETWMLSLNA